MADNQASHVSVLTLRETIETQISHHYTFIHVLKGQLNALALISALPPDILSQIFLHDAGFFGDSIIPAMRMKSRLRIAHVCRRWRAVALDYPILWSRFRVDGYSAACIGKLLSMSRKAPLSIELSLTHRSMYTVQGEAVRSALASLGRVRHLSLAIRGPIIPEIEELLKVPCPLLEYLHITLFPGAFFTHRALESLYISQHSQLRQLHLSNCPADWRRTSLANLTELSILYDSTSDKTRLALDVFLGALARMPRLQMLKTEYAFAFVTEAARESVAVTKALLPHLWKLQLNGEGLASCTLLLDCIDAPRLSRLHVAIEPQYHELQPYSRLFRAISKYASSLGPCRTFSISHPNPKSNKGPSITSYADTFPHDAGGSPTAHWARDRTPGLVLLGRPLMQGSIVAVFCEAFPLGDVQTLMLPGAHPFSFESWKWYDIFKHTSSVVELRLVDWSVSEDDGSIIRKGLGLQTDTSGSHYVPLPNLSTLTLEAAAFRVNPAQKKAAFLDALRDVSAERYENGVAIKHLRILEHRRALRLSHELKLEEADIRPLAEAEQIGEVTYVEGDTSDSSDNLYYAAAPGRDNDDNNEDSTRRHEYSYDSDELLSGWDTDSSDS